MLLIANFSQLSFFLIFSNLHIPYNLEVPRGLLSIFKILPRGLIPICAVPEVGRIGKKNFGGLSTKLFVEKIAKKARKSAHLMGALSRFLVLEAGLEPATYRTAADCSTNELYHHE